MRWRSLLLLGLAWAALAGPAYAQSWPSRPVKLIVPTGPGSGVDVIARLIADGVPNLGQPVVVENIPGASQLLAHQTTARAAPDGYTFLLTAMAGLAANPVMFKSLPYDAARDFTPVAMIVDFAPQMLSVNAEVPVKTVPEFLAYAKANTGKLSYAVDITSAGPVAGRLLNKRAGLDMVEVPYRSAAQMAGDVGSGRIPVTVSSLAASGAMIQAGKIRPVGWFGSRRFSRQPEIPTIAETLPDLIVDGWFVLVTPAGAPADAVNRANHEVGAFLKGADIGDKFARFGLGTSGAGTPQGTAEFIRGEQARWRAIAKELNIEPQ